MQFVPQTDVVSVELAPVRIARDPAIDYAIGLMIRAYRHEGEERAELMRDAMLALAHVDDSD